MSSQMDETLVHCFGTLFSFLSTPSKSCSEIFMPMGALVRASRNKECSWMGTGCLRGVPPQQVLHSTGTYKLP